MKTYSQARSDILDHLGRLSGWTVKRHLKVPQAVMPSGDVLYFRSRAVYLNVHSLWTDIRTLTPQAFVADVERTLKIRESRDPGHRARPQKSRRVRRDRDRHLTGAQRARLRPSQFALPERRKLPLLDKAHVRNAAARLAQMKRRETITKSEYRQARRRIDAAEKKFRIGPYRREPR